MYRSLNKISKLGPCPDILCQYWKSIVNYRFSILTVNIRTQFWYEVYFARCLHFCTEYLHFFSVERPNIYLSRFKCKNFWGFQATRTNQRSTQKLQSEVTFCIFFFLFFFSFSLFLSSSIEINFNIRYKLKTSRKKIFRFKSNIILDFCNL